jgi:PAS domain S-box-containing protein
MIVASIKDTAKTWESALDYVLEMVSIHDADFKMRRVNRRLAETLGCKPERLVGRLCYEVFHKTGEPPPGCPFVRLKENGRVASREYYEENLGMSLKIDAYPLRDEAGRITGCVHVARDVSEIKGMQEKLAITGHMASMVELASGIAHEINNPLTSVIGYLELILAENIPPGIKEDLAIAHHEALRTAEVVGNLLNIARRHAPEKRPFNVNGVLARVLSLRAYEQKVHNIKLRIALASNLPDVIGDIFRIQKAFMNIVINAEFFMIQAHDSGALAITTERVGDVVRVIFLDDGPGIPEENLERIFEPFFTTKADGQGTGLGLSICRTVIADHGGRLYAANGHRGGAMFIVELPVPPGDATGNGIGEWFTREGC